MIVRIKLKDTSYELTRREHVSVKSVSYGSGFYSVHQAGGKTTRYPMERILEVEEIR